MSGSATDAMRKAMWSIQDRNRTERFIGDGNARFANRAGQHTKSDGKNPIYDKEENYENCTVQVLTNTITGDVSIGWWQNDTSDDQTRDYWENTEDVDKYFS